MVHTNREFLFEGVKTSYSYRQLENNNISKCSHALFGGFSLYIFFYYALRLVSIRGRGRWGRGKGYKPSLHHDGASFILFYFFSSARSSANARFVVCANVTLVSLVEPENVSAIRERPFEHQTVELTRFG